MFFHHSWTSTCDKWINQFIHFQLLYGLWYVEKSLYPLLLCLLNLIFPTSAWFWPYFWTPFIVPLPWIFLMQTKYAMHILSISLHAELLVANILQALKYIVGKMRKIVFKSFIQRILLFDKAFMTSVYCMSFPKMTKKIRKNDVSKSFYHTLCSFIKIQFNLKSYSCWFIYFSEQTRTIWRKLMMPFNCGHKPIFVQA